MTTNGLNPIQVKLCRAEKRGRKIICVFESDLFSDEVFALSPFFDEGDDKNQLQTTQFLVRVTEKSGQVKASVEFDNLLTHFTKGHSQLHTPFSQLFLDKKDCARHWAMTEKAEYFNNERINKVLKMWADDPEFLSELQGLIDHRKQAITDKKLDEAVKKANNAFDELRALLQDKNIEALNK